MSQGRRENSRGPAPPPPATNYPNDYAPTPFQPEYQVAQQPYQNSTQFGNYDYVPIMQQPPTSFPAYPPPPSQEYIWNAQIPPPPIISCASSEPAQVPANDVDEEQKRQGEYEKIK